MTARCDVATKSADSVNAKSDLSEEEIEAKAKGRTGGCTIATMDSHRTHTNPSTLLVTSAAELLPSTTVTSLRELLPSVSAFLSAQETLSLVSGCKWALGTGEDTVYFKCKFFCNVALSI
ncbi:unnamed protein product [Brassica oleracea]